MKHRVTPVFVFLKSIKVSWSHISYIKFSITPYTSYDLNWLPYEIVNCKELKDSRISTRALYGNYKNRMGFPRLDQNPVRYFGDNLRCSVCKNSISYENTDQKSEPSVPGEDQHPDHGADNGYKGNGNQVCPAKPCHLIHPDPGQGPSNLDHHEHDNGCLDNKDPDTDEHQERAS